MALDDFINPKTGKKIFGCEKIFDHAAKQNQSKYPWAQNIVDVGLLKIVKGRWASNPPATRARIAKHVKNDLGAHHSPDLFHVQHEVVKATSVPLVSKTKQAQMALEKASEAVNRRIDQQPTSSLRK